MIALLLIGILLAATGVILLARYFEHLVAPQAGIPPKAKND